MAASTVTTGAPTRAATAAPQRPRRARFHVGSWMKYIVLLAFAAFAAAPFLLVWGASVRSSDDVKSKPLGLPTSPTLSNIKTAWTDGDFGEYFLNSVIVAVPVVAITAVVASMAGYALARQKFVGRNAFFYLFVMGLTLPFQSIMIPLFYLLVDWNLIYTYWGLILPQTAISLPFGVFIMRSFFQGLPVSLEEAARIDGCSEWRVFRKVILPLATPGVIALSIFTFVGAWNSYLIPLLYGGTDKRTVTSGLINFQGEFTTDFALMMAGSTIISLPILLLYIVFQRQFISGLTAGAVKG